MRHHYQQQLSSFEKIKRRWTCIEERQALVIHNLSKIQSELDYRHMAETYKDVDVRRVYDKENGWILVICV